MKKRKVKKIYRPALDEDKKEIFPQDKLQDMANKFLSFLEGLGFKKDEAFTEMMKNSDVDFYHFGEKIGYAAKLGSVYVPRVVK